MKRYQPRKGFKITVAILGFTILLIPLLGIYALFGLAAAGVCFLTFGGFEKVIVHPFEDTRRYRECLFGNMYNIEDYLEKEKANLALYQKQQREVWESAKIGIGILITGFLITVISLIIAIAGMAPLILGMIFGYFIMFMSYSWFWDAFINSSLPVAEKISDLFMIRSTSTKITESKKMIGALKMRLEREREKEEQVYGKVLE